MNYFLSGLDINLSRSWCLDFSSHLECEIVDYVSLFEGSLGDFENLIWLYQGPWEGKTSEQALRLWLVFQKKALQLRQSYRGNILFVNTSRLNAGGFIAALGLTGGMESSGKEINNSNLDFILSTSFSMFTPEYWDIFEALELASVIPSGQEPWLRDNFPKAKQADFFNWLEEYEKIKRLPDIEKDNLSYLAQIHSLQDQLEKQVLQVNSLKKAELETTDKCQLLAAQNNSLKAENNSLKAENNRVLSQLKSAPPPAPHVSLPSDRLLLNHLHHAQEELERHLGGNNKPHNSALAVSLSSNMNGQKPLYYGAADRVKQQLTYRLGAVAISHSRSFMGWLKMPLAFRKELKAYKHDRKARHEQVKLPSIFSYQDAYLADRARKHLSYQVGEVLVKHGKRPWKWLVLPFAVWSTVQRYRTKRIIPQGQIA